MVSALVPEIAWEDLPMDRDRAAGWSVVREAGRVVRSNDVYLVSHRDDALHALRHPELFSSQRAFDNLGSPLPLVPIAFDPPNHCRYRKFLQPFFSPRTIAGMLPSLQAQLAELIDGLVDAGECDLVTDLAIPYPSTVFLTLFGLPVADRDRLRDWKDAALRLGAVGARTADPAELDAVLECLDYLAGHVDRQRHEEGPGILSQLLHGPDALDDVEAVGMSFLFILAGLDTVTSAIGLQLHHLAAHPDRRRDLIADPELIPDYVEEMLRTEPPVPMIPRVTTEDVSFGDLVIPANSMVQICLGAINREDESAAVHWGFGAGAHRCLGSHLARIELRLVITEWLRRIPDFEIASGATPEITWPAITFQFAHLPVVYPRRLSARPGAQTVPSAVIRRNPV